MSYKMHLIVKRKETVKLVSRAWTCQWMKMEMYLAMHMHSAMFCPFWHQSKSIAQVHYLSIYSMRSFILSLSLSRNEKGHTKSVDKYMVLPLCISRGLWKLHVNYNMFMVFMVSNYRMYTNECCISGHMMCCIGHREINF